MHGLTGGGWRRGSLVMVAGKNVLAGNRWCSVASLPTSRMRYRASPRPSEADLDTEPWRLDDGALRAAGGAFVEHGRAVYVGLVKVVAELWGRTARTKDDRTVVVANLVEWWKITPAEARDLVRHAELFGREEIRDAAEAGVLSRQHLDVLDKTITEAPEPDRDKVAALLLAEASKLDGAAFKKVGQRILQHLDQDDKEPDDPELAEPTREFHFANRRDGSMVFRGRIDPESGAKLAAMISPLAKPTSATDHRTTPQPSLPGSCETPRVITRGS